MPRSGMVSDDLAQHHLLAEGDTKTVQFEQGIGSRRRLEVRQTRLMSPFVRE